MVGTQEGLVLTPERTQPIATRLHALAEPARLPVRDALRGGDHTPGELAAAAGLGTANVSRQSQRVHAASFVIRRK